MLCMKISRVLYSTRLFCLLLDPLREGLSRQRVDRYPPALAGINQRDLGAEAPSILVGGVYRFKEG